MAAFHHLHVMVRNSSERFPGARKRWREQHRQGQGNCKERSDTHFLAYALFGWPVQPSLGKRVPPADPDDDRKTRSAWDGGKSTQGLG